MAEKKKKPFLGYSVFNGMLRYTSVTQIKLFDPNTNEGCPRKWAFPYRFGKKLAKTGSLEGGIDKAEKLEHYLTTGEDVLPPELQGSKKYWPQPRAPFLDLECERPLGDTKAAVELRDAILVGKAENDLALLKKLAGLTIRGIPVEGAADCRHYRGEYVDANGVLQKEAPDTVVSEILDLKAVSMIYPRKVHSGPDAGKIIQPFTKTDAEVCEDIQMLGYAQHNVNVHPELTHVRLMHVYANTKKKNEATKRGGLISVAEVLRRSSKIDVIVEQMEHGAKFQRIEDFEPNLRACDSFTHVDPNNPTSKIPIKGCGHRYYCPQSIHQITQNMIGQYKESAMSLCDTVPGVPAVPVHAAPVAPPAPQLTAEQHAAEVEAHRQRLLAEDAGTVAPAAPTAPVALGFCAQCGTPLSAMNTSVLQGGMVKHIGCVAAPTPMPPIPTTMAPFVSPPAVPSAPFTPPSSPIAVNPPDQPRIINMLDAAAPLPQSEIDKIEDPELRQRVMDHAKLHAEAAAIEAKRIEDEKVAAGTSVWCSTSLTKLVVTTAMAVAGKWICTCTKEYSVKKLMPIQEGDLLTTVIPRHKPKNKEAAPVLVVPAETLALPPAPAVVQVAAIVASPMPVASSQAQQMLALPTNGANGHAAAPPPPPPPVAPPPATGPRAQVRQDIMAFQVSMKIGPSLVVMATSMTEALQFVDEVAPGNQVTSINLVLGNIVLAK